jgi:hypothetical protein
MTLTADSTVLLVQFYDGHICAPLKDTKMAAAYQILYNFPKIILAITGYETRLHIAII